LLFEQLDFPTEGMSDTFFHECFISGLKDDIQAHVLMAHPQTWLEATHQSQGSTTGSLFSNKKSILYSPFPPTNPTPPSPPLKIHKLTREEMVECQLKGLCYNCDEKYFLGHKCKEKNIFMAISEDISEDDGDVSPSEALTPSNDHTHPLIHQKLNHSSL
jgi:hypothetical protein